MSDNSLLKEKDVAAWLAVSIRTVRGWRRRKTGPPYIKMGTAVRYPQGGLQEFLRDRQVGGVTASASDTLTSLDLVPVAKPETGDGSVLPKAPQDSTATETRYKCTRQ